MLPILYQDAHLIAVNKPPGLLVHRTGLDAGETRFALQLLRDQIGQPVWPLHRLDKGTSGVLLFGLSAEVARIMGPRFEDGGALAKTYLAVVRGWPADDQGLVAHPLRRLADDAGRARTETQAARTRWRVLARAAVPVAHGAFDSTRCALLALQPGTGRRHQLRRHCKHMAHPILGDATHGKGPLNRAVAAWMGSQRLWLHAWRLALTHPVHGTPLALQAPLAPEWSRWPWGAMALPD